MRDMALFEKGREIGPAIWLLLVYWAAGTSDGWPWFIVADGAPLTDEEVAAFLNISAFTAARWRRRLMGAGLVQAERSGRRYRIRVQRPNFATALVRDIGERARSPRGRLVLATQLIQ